MLVPHPLYSAVASHLDVADPSSSSFRAGAIGHSYADQPLRQSWYFDSSKPSGKRWARAGVSTIDRMYHSAATLLPDGSVLVSGSNPNPDCSCSLFLALL